MRLLRALRRLELPIFVLALAGLGAMLFFALRSEAKRNVMLRVLPANPRYFADPSGAPVYLTGSHTWADLVDWDTQTPPRALDYQGFLRTLRDNGHNFVRLWTWEQPRFADQSGTKRYADPLPWRRIGPGRASDGLPRFDLTRFDPRYFERLRARVVAAQQAGVYVSVMLFEGWELQFSKPPYNWRTHPFNGANNVNGIDGDLNGDGNGTEIHTLSERRVTALQEAYVRRVVETVYDLDNVLFEIANESGGYSTRWQYHMIDVIKEHQRGLGVQHPVGMTFQLEGGDNAALLAGPADWISPGGFGLLRDPPPADGRKVVLLDTDHVCGVCGDPSFVFKAFFRGYNPIYMDPITDTPEKEANHRAVRRAMGQTARLAQRIDLAVMTPHPELFSTRYGLANPGATYLAYQPARGSFSVDLRGAGGRLSAEWINPETGSTVAGGPIVGGRRVSLQPPFPGSAVLLLQKS